MVVTTEGAVGASGKRGVGAARVAAGRAPGSAWQLSMAENGFRQSFLEGVAH